MSSEARDLCFGVGISVCHTRDILLGNGIFLIGGWVYPNYCFSAGECYVFWISFLGPSQFLKYWTSKDPMLLCPTYDCCVFPVLRQKGFKCQSILRVTYPYYFFARQNPTLTAPLKIWRHFLHQCNLKDTNRRLTRDIFIWVLKIAFVTPKTLSLTCIHHWLTLYAILTPPTTSGMMRWVWDGVTISHTRCSTTWSWDWNWWPIYFSTWTQSEVRDNPFGKSPLTILFPNLLQIVAWWCSFPNMKTSNRCVFCLDSSNRISYFLSHKCYPYFRNLYWKKTHFVSLPTTWFWGQTWKIIFCIILAEYICTRPRFGSRFERRSFFPESWKRLNFEVGKKDSRPRFQLWLDVLHH